MKRFVFHIAPEQLREQLNEYGFMDFPLLTIPHEYEEPEAWPYDDATLGIMNQPWLRGPQMTS